MDVFLRYQLCFIFFAFEKTRIFKGVFQSFGRIASVAAKKYYKPFTIKKNNKSSILT